MTSISCNFLLAHFSDAVAKLQKETISFAMSLHVCLDETTGLPLDRLSRNLISEGSSKICGEKFKFD
jgi:hypothetical protein